MHMSRYPAIALLALTVTPLAHAAVCTDNANVQTSSQSDAKNRAAGGKGGHVGLHMKNATLPLPPSGATSQIDKSAFENWAAFKQAFDKWRQDTTKPHVNCGTSGGPKDIVDASLLGVTRGWKCTKTGSANNLCETWEEFTPAKVCFWYYNAPGSGGTAGKWLLNTAYPSLNADCS